MSDLGRVRRLETVVHFSDGRVRRFPGRDCNYKTANTGYKMVLLSRGVEHKKWTPVHTLVLTAFVGPRPEGFQACHNNGDRKDARLENLRWDTPAANANDRRVHGTMFYGEKHPTAVFPDSVLDQVRRAEGTIDEISARFGMSRTHAWNVRNNKRRAVR